MVNLLLVIDAVIAISSLIIYLVDKPLPKRISIFVIVFYYEELGKKNSSRHLNNRKDLIIF